MQTVLSEVILQWIWEDSLRSLDVRFFPLALQDFIPNKKTPRRDKSAGRGSKRQRSLDGKLLESKKARGGAPKANF